jgi:hypothetical protein
MGFFDKLFGKLKTTQKVNLNDQEPEHAVIIRFDYGIEGLGPLHTLEDKLEEVITENNAGEYDGHEIAMDYSDGFLYMYGPNAEILFNAVKPVLTETEFMKGAKAKLRFGPPEEGVKEVEVEI